MSIKKYYGINFTLLIAAVLPFSLPSISQAQELIRHDKNMPFNRAVIFGDSLSDNGYFPDWVMRLTGKNTTNGRFSNGNIWDEYLFPIQARGVKLSPFGPYRNGDYGNHTENGDSNVNYAIGGSTYTPGNSFSGHIKDFYMLPIDKQIGKFTQNNNTFSRDNLISLWAGANDALNAIDEGLPADEQAALVAGKLSDALEQLYRAGARQFLLPNMPDFSKVPRFNGNNTSIPHQTAEAFNKAIADSIAAFHNKHRDTTVFAPEMNGLLDTVINHPDLFGFKNATDACTSIAECKKAPAGATLQNEYLFWDDVHPTTMTHHYIANYMEEYWQNPNLAGFYVRSPEGRFETERNYFFPTTDKAVTGYLTGNRALYKLNAGKLTLTGDHSYTGGTFVIEGELELGNGGRTGSVTGDVNLEQKTTFAFNHSNLLELNGIVSGQGAVVQRGSGITVLNAANSYSGATDITNGELMVNGSIISPVAVHTGGALSGMGYIGNLTAENGSVVSPGDFRSTQNGSLTVSGDARFQEGSTLAIASNIDGSTSALNVTGSAYLAGTVVFGDGRRGIPLSVADTLAMLGKEMTFITADSGVQGQFERVRPEYRFIGATLDYQPKNVQVSFAETGRRFAEDAKTPNQHAVADALQALGRGNQLYDNIAASTFSDDLSGAYAQLSGDIYASLQTSLLQDSLLTRDAVLQRMANLFDAHLDQSHASSSGIWGQAYGANTRFSSDGNAQAMKRNLAGFISGIDGQLADNWRLGLFTGYMQGSLDAGSSSATVNSYQLGAYSGYKWDKLKLAFGGNAMLHDIESQRSIAFKELNHSNHADFRGYSFQGFTELSYGFQTKLAQIEPFAGISYAYVKTDAFAESDSPSAVSGAASATDALSTLLGTRIQRTDIISDTASVDTILMAGWQHNSRQSPRAELSFNGGGDFTINGLALERDTFVTQAGLNFNFGPNTTVGLTYLGQMASGLQDHALKANISVHY